MNESCRKSERHKRRHPDGRPQLRRKRTKDSVAVVHAGLAICFHLKNGQQYERQHHKKEHDRPRPHIQFVQEPAHDAGRWS